MKMTGMTSLRLSGLGPVGRKGRFRGGLNESLLVALAERFSFMLRPKHCTNKVKLDLGCSPFRTRDSHLT